MYLRICLRTRNHFKHVQVTKQHINSLDYLYHLEYLDMFLIGELPIFHWLSSHPDQDLLLQRSFVDLLSIHFHSGRVVGLQDQAIDVRGAITFLLVGQIRLFQDVLTLVVEDQMSSSASMRLSI